MQVIPIKTKIFKPPQDDLFAGLDEALTGIQEKDVLVISSKIVAIGEGRCIRKDAVDKQQLAEREAEIVIPRDYWSTPLTIAHHAFIGTAGVDASNAGQYYVLLPTDPFESAARIRMHVQQKHDLQDIDVVISDSHSTPLRRGAVGIAIGYAGVAPTNSLVGEKDLFGRAFKVEVANIVDSIAAAANLTMGEGSERQPIAVVRGLSDISFTEDIDKDHFMVPYNEDTFRVLYERFLT